jgi:hypothetical protein
MAELDEELEPYETAVGTRLGLGLALLSHEEVRQRIDEVELLDEEVSELVKATELAQGLQEQLLGIRDRFDGLMALLAALQQGEAPATAGKVLTKRTRKLAQMLKAVRRELAGHRYPFHVQTDAEVSLEDYVMSRKPDPDDIGSVGDGADGVVSKLLPLHPRSIARLAVIAQQVETALGLDPLPEYTPPAEEPPSDSQP